jgi:hypothetical protein
MPRSWIYHLDRAALTAHAIALKLDTAGSVDDLRRRLSQYVIAHPEYIPANMAHPGAAPEIRIEIPRTPEARDNEAEPPLAGGGPASDSKQMSQIRKWGCHFDGKDPISFLERLEELQAEYGFTDAQLLRGLPELLRGEALLWYRNNRDAWNDWPAFIDEFRDYYLPRRYFAKLKREIQARTQGTDEPYRKYATDLLTMMRRAGGYDKDDQLDQLYDNIQPRYKLYVRRDGLRRPTDLLRQAEEFEEISAQCRDRAATPKPSASTATVAYDKNECCWRCKQRGHTRFDCRRIAKKFCSQCGKDGVYTRDCHPPPGNASRTGETPTAPRSSE